jgi:F-type H+-transporting ATPase subunit alpha
VVVLYAGVRGFIDKYPIEKIKEYEKQLLSFMSTKHQAVLDEIDEKQELKPDLDDKIKGVLTEFDSVFASA